MIQVESGNRVLIDMTGELVIAKVLETTYFHKFDASFLINETKKMRQCFYFIHKSR